MMKTSTKLYSAATILEVSGMVSGARTDYEGRHCALGGLDVALGGNSQPYHNYADPGYMDDHYQDAVKALAVRLRSMDVSESHQYPEGQTYANGSVVATWSNHMVDDGKDAEVIALFRSVADELAMAGK